MKTVITGTGSSIPKFRATNSMLSEIVDTSDEWIRERTGIEARHLAMEETTAGMATKAAEAAMEMAGIRPEELDLIIAGSVTQDNVVPGLACEVQAALGAEKAVAFDLGAACSGFLFSLSTADMYLKQGSYKKALVIGAEVLSRIIDWKDRSTCVLFGDGAGAVVLEAREEEENRGLCTHVMGSDGAKGSALLCENRVTNHPYHKEEPFYSYVKMDGQAVYRFAVRTVPEAIQQALDRCGWQPEDVDYYILHQANARIIESVSKRLKQPISKFPMNMQECGNISSASVPILLDEVCRCQTLQKGAKIVLAGFGAGLTWGVTTLIW